MCGVSNEVFQKTVEDLYPYRVEDQAEWKTWPMETGERCATVAVFFDPGFR